MSIENLLDPILMPPDLFNELGEAYEEAKGNNDERLILAYRMIFPRPVATELIREAIELRDYEYCTSFSLEKYTFRIIERSHIYNPLVRSINARDSKFFEDSIAILDRLWDDYSSSEILELVIARKLLEGHGRATEADIYHSMPAEYVRGVASSAATWDRIARRLGGRVSAGGWVPRPRKPIDVDPLQIDLQKWGELMRIGKHLRPDLEPALDRVFATSSSHNDFCRNFLSLSQSYARGCAMLSADDPAERFLARFFGSYLWEENNLLKDIALTIDESVSICAGGWPKSRILECLIAQFALLGKGVVATKQVRQIAAKCDIHYTDQTIRNNIKRIAMLAGQGRTVKGFRHRDRTF